MINEGWHYVIVQMIATVLAAFIQVGVKQWIFENVPDICKPKQVSQLTCPHNQVFYTASAVWWVLILIYKFLLLLTIIFKGSHWPSTSIWYRLHLPSQSLRIISRSLHPSTILPLATTFPHFMGPLRKHACRHCWSFIYATCYGHQL